LNALVDIQIDSQGLSAIYGAGQVVTLMRRVDQAVDTGVVAGAPAVAWQAFAPLQTNTVSWTDDIYCFATTTPLVMSAVIGINAKSDAPMEVGYVYEFTQGQFVKQQACGQCSYMVGNAMPLGSFAFGLAQVATVNSVTALAPFCAAPVLYNERAYFNPTAAIATFLSTARAAGAILPAAPSNAFDAIVKPGTGGPTLGFNDRTNMFFLLSERSEP
jgi:hypothetical protein